MKHFLLAILLLVCINAIAQNKNNYEIIDNDLTWTKVYNSGGTATDLLKQMTEKLSNIKGVKSITTNDNDKYLNLIK